MERTFSLFSNWTKPKKKYCYFFNDGWAEEKELLGRKGADLCEMFRLGLPVPNGFVLSTEACRDYHKHGSKELPKAIEEEIERAVKTLELQTGKQFGSIKTDPENSNYFVPPLALSVRVTAPVEIHGLAPTTLNLGFNSLLVHTIAKEGANSRWIYDSYARFLMMFGTTVLHLDPHQFDEVYKEACDKSLVSSPSELSDIDMKDIVAKFRAFTHVPEDPWDQLYMSIKSIYDSWFSRTAIQYRELHNISTGLYSAVVIQSMVYGNLNETSGSGMAYTRNPNTGLKELYGEYLNNAVGEDVLLGLRPTMKLEQLYQIHPDAYNKLINIEHLLEHHYRDMQLVEFTVENGNLFILETRHGRRSAFAAAKIASDMVYEKIITEREALLHLNADQLTHFLFPTLDPHYVDSYADRLLQDVLCRGRGAGYGAAVGKIVFNLEDVNDFEEKDRIILCVTEINGHSDIQKSLKKIKIAGLLIVNNNNLQGSLQRQCERWNKIAVNVAQDLIIDNKAQKLRTKNGKFELNKGDTVTIDGSTGLVYYGEIPTVTPIHDAEFQTILRWADKYKRLQVLANADSAEDVKKAIELGAEGVGLCRTEHMFFHPDRINLFRQLILSTNMIMTAGILDTIHAQLKQHFSDILCAEENHEVVIRLFNGSLCDFFPTKEFDSIIKDISSTMGVSFELCRQNAIKIQEDNSFIGCRGARLAISDPLILDIQIRAIFDALIEELKDNCRPNPDITILIPFVVSELELDTCVDRIMDLWSIMWNKETLKTKELPFKLGVILEIPRAFLVASKIASRKEMQLICFDGGALTEFVFGMSYEDAGLYLDQYMEKNLLSADPFHSLDTHGVCNILRYAKRKIRDNNDHAKIMMVGDVGYDRKSVDFLEREGIDCVTCSSSQVPKMKVLAAQAHIRHLSGDVGGLD